ncbi:MAG: hypothetical protein N3G20_02630, partial [Verrucomicrobiae bacterium]|nr:hypothetical protein [Verrucomicrobiae bacterium]
MKLTRQLVVNRRKWPGVAGGLRLQLGRGTCVAVIGLLLLCVPANSQQQFQGICARAKIRISQELTIERIGFLATLEVTNNDAEDPITDFSAELTFENPALSTENAKNDSRSLFFVRAPELQNVNSVNGDGVIGPTKKAVVSWFIIPKIAAGGTSPEGVRYRVGCRLAGKMNGVPLPPEILFAVPDEISVKPEPHLDIVYFQPRDVQGDDPFTVDVVESPIPFTLGVIVRNVGYGIARALKIVSEQPRIVENKGGLLLVAQLIGSRVMDSPRQPSLTVELGDIMPVQAKKGAWDMITSLSGEFIEFRATYRHTSELGGEETSIIKSIQAHFITQEVLNDQYGRDGIRDFLADTDRDPEMIPDALYESEGNVLPVNYLAEATVEGEGRPGGTVIVRLVADKAGWGYTRVPDPGQGRLKIAAVVRSDGKVLNRNNAWVSTRHTRIGNVRQNWLNIFDLV